MTNVTVQEALNNDVELIRAVLEGFQNCYPRSDGLAACRRIKAALSEIEKCEPELYMAKNLHNKSYATSHSEAEARLFLRQSGLKVDGVESEVIALCRCGTSPQPREWVGLSVEQIEDCYPENNLDKFPQVAHEPCMQCGWVRCSAQWQVDFANAVIAKHIQLNTKG